MKRLCALCLGEIRNGQAVDKSPDRTVPEERSLSHQSCVDEVRKTQRRINAVFSAGSFDRLDRLDR